MRRFCNILFAPFLVMLVCSALSHSAQAQTVLQDRITQPIESANMAVLAGTAHPLAKPEFDTGLTDNAKILQGMTIHFKRSAAQEASLQALLAAQQNPSSASYHQWLTQAQFGQLFGMSASDLAQVSAWLQQEGFTITSVAQSANSINFSGSVASVEKAFQTQIHNYTVNGETHFANSTQISIPAAFAGTVTSVHGLDDFRLKPRVRALKSRFTDGLTGVHLLAPGDLAVIYDISPLTGGSPNWSGPDTGKGVTIAIIGQTAIVPADITDFRAAAGLPANPPTVVTVPGTTPPSAQAGAASGDLAETDLDLEYSGGVAVGASIVLVNSGDVTTSLTYAVQNTINGITIPIISQSYGACEAAYNTAALTAQEAILAQANAQGQTVILAAGDNGAADCDESTATVTVTSAVNGLAVDYPGSSVYVTDAGGSEFMGDGTAASPQTGAGTYWNSSGTGSVSDDLVTSAKSYIPEMVWNDTTFSIANGGGLDAGGGGVSQLWAKPSWQTGVPGIPADGHRDVPDISLTASNAHDPYLYCTQVTTDGSPSAFVSSCQATSFRLSDPGQTDNNTFQAVAGGTSFAAPDFAGLLAIIEQKLGISGGLGNINPSLYTLAANATTYASAFHDITTGNNEVPCTAGSPNCPTGSNPVIGYAAGTGYDLATGLGSVDANNLATAFAALVAATGTKTTLTVSPGTSVVLNEKVTFTATVAPNTLSTAPTGTVTFTVDGVAGTPVTLSTAAPYTATFTTDFATSGTHTVSATYSSGDTTYTGSSSSATVITVVASGTAATTTAVTANPTTLPLGNSVTLTATISGTTAGTLTGPVTFTTGGVTIGKVNQVTLGSGNTATATLTVNATASLGFTPGTDTITATYGGDTFNATSSGTTTVTVTNPSIAVTATAMTISSPNPGNTGTSTITITSTGGYMGTVNLTATGPSTLNVDGSFASSSIPLASGASATTTLTITTVAANGNLRKGVGGNVHKTSTAQIAVAGGTVAGCLLLLLIPGIRRKRWPAALVMLVFLSVGAGLGCGGGTGGGAPSGTYTVTVTATDSSNANITGSTTFTLTIQ